MLPIVIIVRLDAIQKINPFMADEDAAEPGKTG
jgi:hypothetical protein